MNRRPIELLSGLLLLLACTAAPALDSDRDQPIYIEADRVDIDDVRGISVYRGNVRMSQGTLVITGDVVTTHHDADHHLTRAVSEGAPASYRQLLEGQSRELEAYAPRMEYRVDERLIYLLDGARVIQGKSVFEGNRIEYDMAEDVIRAEGDASGKGRVRAVIQPQEQGAVP
jgi:lipopolysaccharide export system protein LptA